MNEKTRARLDATMLGVFSAVESQSFVQRTAYLLRDALRVERCGIWVSDIAGNLSNSSFTTDLPEDIFESYLEYYSGLNPIMPKVAPRIFEGEIVSSSQAMEDRAYKNTEFYTDFVRHLGYFYELGFAISIGINAFSSITFQRQAYKGDFTNADRTALAYVKEPLVNAFRLRRSLMQREHMSTSDVIHLNEAGHCSDWSGALIEELLQDRVMQISARRVSFRNTCTNALFAEYLSAASADTQQVEDFQFETNGRRFRVKLVDTQLATDGPGFCVSVRESDPQNQLGRFLETLQVRWGITPRELDLLCSIAMGGSVAEFSQVKRLSIYTARTHMKRLLTKLDCQSQVEAVVWLIQNLEANRFSLTNLRHLRTTIEDPPVGR